MYGNTKGFFINWNDRMSHLFFHCKFTSGKKHRKTLILFLTCKLN